MRQRMKIGLLETGEVNPALSVAHGDYPSMFARLLGRVDASIEFFTVRVVAGELPAGPEAADAWLVTGSRHGVYDDLPWIEPLKRFLLACVAARVPVVGICFGHQILAEALGGRAEKSDRGWGLGVMDYELVYRPGWLVDVPGRFAANAVHQDQVVALPPGATVLARSAHCPYAALAYGDPENPDALTLQPHPEFDDRYMDDLLAHRAGVAFPASEAAAARASLSRPVASDAWARIIVDYLQRAVAARQAAA
jgi:GMP synthase-like glutamine amidotransferase